MKIDLVLTACNNNNSYLYMYPIVYKVWKKKFNLDCYLILISDFIPSFLEEFKDFIILHNPIEGLNTIYIAQTIRILYPGMFDNKNVLITDMDIIPVSNYYFIESIKNISDDIFISYTSRYLKQKMLAICYNLANSNIWKEIFKINSKDDIDILLKKWYNPNYEGIKNSKGWFLDQEKLYEYIMEYKKINNDKVIIFDDLNIKYKRLDKGANEIRFMLKNNKTLLDNFDYSDMHISKRYNENGPYRLLVLRIIDFLCK